MVGAIPDREETMRGLLFAAIVASALCLTSTAMAELTEWGSDDCKAIAGGDPSYCRTDDCKGIVKKDASYCRSDDCKGMAKGDPSYCRNENCKAIVKKDKSYCR